MVKNQNIICISSIDWDFIWQGHQEIMFRFAKNGNRVLFIENTGARAPGIRDALRIKNRIKNWSKGISGIRQIEENLYIFSPILLPFPYLRIATWINQRLILSVLKRWFRVMDFVDPIIWVFLPTPLTLSIIDNLFSKITVYYCIDNFRVSSASAKKIKDSEIKLLERADLVFVTSRELYSYCFNYNDKVHFFPFAVNFKKFEETRLSNLPIPDGLRGIKRPIVGYIGGVHKWVDLNLVKKAAQVYPQYSFVFIGPIQTDISFLSELRNIHFLHQVGHKEIPNFIKNLDVCIIPYLITDYTNNVYPTKLNEYLAMGKPIVSTGLPEVINFNIENDNVVSIGNNREEFINCISGAFLDTSGSKITKRISIASRNSWDKRIEEMSILIEEDVDRKSKMPFDWKESFLKIYRKAQRRFARVSFIFLAFYLLIFYTPLIWFLARPLRISNPPIKTDCIVVFAGGVGESGKAQDGYQERVKHAVELFNQGFAKNIIFSSGYMSVFQEPLVMKALAISLGVPENAIILEDKAANTYQNVKFSTDILLRKGWNEILLVSSPYHMRRVSLVFNKIGKNIKVIYTPLINSSFYAHPQENLYGRKIWKRINLRQIKGIIHEYLAIICYRWRRWL